MEDKAWGIDNRKCECLWSANGACCWSPLKQQQRQQPRLAAPLTDSNSNSSSSRSNINIIAQRRLRNNF